MCNSQSTQEKKGLEQWRSSDFRANSFDSAQTTTYASPDPVPLSFRSTFAVCRLQGMPRNFTNFGTNATIHSRHIISTISCSRTAGYVTKSGMRSAGASAGPQRST